MSQFRLHIGTMTSLLFQSILSSFDISFIMFEYKQIETETNTDKITHDIAPSVIIQLKGKVRHTMCPFQLNLFFEQIQCIGLTLQTDMLCQQCVDEGYRNPCAQVDHHVCKL